MRDDDRIFHTCGCGIREIADIFLYFSFFEGFYNSLFIYQHITCKVQDHDIFFHQIDCILIDHLSGRIQQRYMDRDIIASTVNIIHIFDVLYAFGKFPCRINRNVRIITIYIHTQTFCHVCHLDTDCTKSDDTKLFAHQFASCKFLLFFFCLFCDIFASGFGFCPFHTADDITGSQQHACDHQLFYAVCIGSRCVKYNDTFFCTFIQRNVVDTGTGTCNCIQTIRQFQIMHGSTSYQHCVCIFHFFCFFVTFCELIQSYRSDRV